MQQATGKLKNSKGFGYDDILAELLREEIETASDVSVSCFSAYGKKNRFPMTGAKDLS